MTPIGTIYQADDGNYSVTSSVATPLALTRILSALTHAMLGQVKEAPSLTLVNATIDASNGDVTVTPDSVTDTPPDAVENAAQAPA